MKACVEEGSTGDCVALVVPPVALVVAAAIVAAAPAVVAAGEVETARGGRDVPVVAEKVTEVFHKGNLAGGMVDGVRTLSTGTSKEAVSALDRAGSVFTFRIPDAQLTQWKYATDNWGSPLARTLTDLDNATGVVNQEIRFSPLVADQLNQYLVK